MRLRLLMPALLSLFTALIIFALPMIASAQGKIAFVSNRDGNDEIYVMNEDGSNPVRLTNSSAPDYRPVFDLAGSRIVYVSNVAPGRLWRMNSDGTENILLTSGTDSHTDPSFAPDGAKIAYSFNPGPGFGLVTVNSDGTNRQTLVPFVFGNSDVYPSYSKDGTRVVFARSVGGLSSIWGMDASGTNLSRRSTISGASDFDPAFSPDGTKVIFRSNRDGNDELYIMNFDGTGQARITNDPGIDKEPVFSPDGTKIAFASNRTGNFEIYVMNLDGTNLVPLTSTPGFNNHDISWVDPSFAPPALSNLGLTQVVNEGGTATLSGNMATPDQSLALSLTVNWGDGSQQTFDYPAGTTSFSETHEYLDDGPSGTPSDGHVVDVVLTTTAGTDRETLGLVVNNLPPSLSIGAIPLSPLGSPTTVSGSVTDPGVLDAQTVTVNWGDGSPQTVLNLLAGVTDFSANHSYAAMGAYTVTVSATDDDGGAATPVNMLVGVVPLPTSGKIAFTSNFGGNNNIYLMNSNGTGQIPLTTNPASDSYPDLSADGSKIVFVSDRDGNPEIYVMNAAGAFQTRLTNNLAIESEPVFSPDGSKIVFSSNRDGNHEIYIMNADGTGQQRLTTNSVDDGQAEFSPVGTKIIFSRLAANQTDAHIITMDLNGANQLPLTTGSFVLNGYPSYSHDGLKIVFSRANLSHTNAEIYTMDANGANAVRLTTAAGDDLESAFSPDASKIVFRSERDGNSEIYLMDAAGTNQQRITFDGPGFSNFAPSWSDVSVINVDVPDDLAAGQGATLTVPIVVSDTTGKGVISYDFTLIFDPAVLQLQTPAFDKVGTLSSGFEVNTGSSSPGLVTVSAFGAVPLSGAGTLLNLKFDVIGTPPTSSLLTLHPFIFNEGIPFSELSSGQVFVQGTISGTVYYGTALVPVGVPNVTLSAVGSPNASTSTAADGTYALSGFGPGSYSITPAKSGNVNGVTAFDASLISQFLVGTGTLSPTQQSAGEVSGNGTLTSFDAALIAQYVVNLPNTGQTGTWRFSPASRFYPTVGSLVGEDYSAILMGEVSGNWTAAGLHGFMAKAPGNDKDKSIFRAQSELIASLPSVGVRQNDTVVIPLMIDFVSIGTDIKAYQFDILFDPGVLQLEQVPFDTVGTLSTGFGAASNGTAPGRLKLAVYGSDSINSNGTLIYLKFRVVGSSGSKTSLEFKDLLFNEGDPVAEGIKGEIVVQDQPAEDKYYGRFR